MASRLRAGESPARAVRRIVKRQIDKTLDRLDGHGGSEPEASVHDPRKRLKKVRAMLRLARGGLGRKLAYREDARFRDVGRPLSAVRDACVLVEEFDGLIERAEMPEDPEAADRIRSAVLGPSRSISRSTIEGEKCLETTAYALKEARKAVKRWRVEKDGWDLLREGLGRIYSR